ncbi:MAG: homoserine kinase [Firmicutes bacterium]|nr:homoserine kinase [Bacillota bacterium]
MAATGFRIQIPATTANCGCGYDSFGMALGYYNDIEIRESDAFSIDIEGEGANTLAFTPQNLVVRSAQAAYELAGISMPPLSFLCRNNIPLARGMGSSSAAIVGGIYAANLMMGKPLDHPAMLELASKIEGHPDNVAPALYGGFTVIANEGGKQYIKKVALPDTLHAVLASPDFPISTKKARAIMPRNVSLDDAVYSLSHAAYLALSIAEGDMAGLRAMLFDRLHQPYRFTLIKGAEDVVEAAIAAGAIGCVISGSGPTMIAFTEDDPILMENIGYAMQEAFAAADVTAQIRKVEMDNQGVRLA